ncbi:MAG: hypothetical protein R3266_02525, partial [Gemmatimonadota bacterium]|nr:hypothetical protein [Gemmatimonadota bacterium]
MRDADVWGARTLDADQDLRLDLGPLALTLRAREDELWVAAEREADGSREPRPENGWERWAGSGASRVRLLPTLPDRPLVVAPEVPFHLAPGSRVRIYVRIPVWVTVRFEATPDAILFETPTAVLSDTWWGDFVSGEL